MSNRLQYIAVKKDYYSGKAFNPASAYITYLDMNNSEGGFIVNGLARYFSQNWV